MKITKKQLRKIIKESASPIPMKSRASAAVKSAVSNSRRQEQMRNSQIKEGDTATNDELSQKAASLGGYLGGYPQLANDLADAFRKSGRDGVADALMKTYNAAQQHLDMIYSAYD